MNLVELFCPVDDFCQPCGALIAWRPPVGCGQVLWCRCREGRTAGPRCVEWLLGHPFSLMLYASEWL